MTSQALLCPTEHIGSRGYAIRSQQTNACAIAKFLRHSQIPNSFATFAFSFLLVPYQRRGTYSKAGEPYSRLTLSH